MADIRKRQPIHDQNAEDLSENPKVNKCSKCNLIFEVLPNGNEQEVKAEGFREEEIDAPNLYPDLSEEMLFQCQRCKSGVSNCTVEWKTFQKHLPKLLPWLGLVLGIFLFLIIYLWLKSFMVSKDESFPVNDHGQNVNEQKLDYGCLQLEKTLYKNQNEEIWPIVLSGIKAITRNKPNQPAVFLMLYSDRSAGRVAQCLAKKLSELATEYMGIGRTQPVELTGKELDNSYFIEDGGRFLEKYEEPIRRNGAMILTDLQDMPTEVVKRLHFVSDKFSPLVEKAVYFFTVYEDSIPQDYRQWSKTAQQTLRNLWNSNINSELLSPLLARITQEPIAISSGDSIHC